MKIEQFQYILAIYETGSISKAAERFYLSRPNISNAVRNLENELGFEIMERGAKGVRFTKEGLLFVQKAVRILKDVDEIQEIGNSRSRLRFGIVNPNCPMVEEAFIRLCGQVETAKELKNYQVSLYREYQYEGMRLLNQKKADLVITVSNNLNAPSMIREMEERGLEYRKLLDVPCNVNLSKNQNQKKADLVITVSNNLNAPSMIREMEERGLEYRKLLDVPCNVNLSKNHPLKKADLVITVSNNLNAPSMIREMEERGLEYRKLLDVPCNVNLSKNHPLAQDPDFKLEKLKDYPFVEYAIEGDRGFPYNRISQVSFINLSKLFRVSSGNMRTRVIAATNAYSVGIAMPPSWAEEYGLCCIPIPAGQLGQYADPGHRCHQRLQCGYRHASILGGRIRPMLYPHS